MPSMQANYTGDGAVDDLRFRNELLERATRVYRSIQETERQRERLSRTGKVVRCVRTGLVGRS